jgi:hypothetical protein
MQAINAFVTLAIICSATGAGPGDERVKKQLQSENYTVTWGTAGLSRRNKLILNLPCRPSSCGVLCGTACRNR